MTHLGHVEGHGRAGAGILGSGSGAASTSRRARPAQDLGAVPGTLIRRVGETWTCLSPSWSRLGPCCLQPLRRQGPGDDARRNQFGQKSMFPSSELPAASHEEEWAIQSWGGNVFVEGSYFS